MLSKSDFSTIKKLIDSGIENLLVQLAGVFKEYATKDDLKTLATKDDLKTLATKDELDSVKADVRDIKRDVWDIKTDMVTNKEFNRLEKRTKTLEDLHQKQLRAYA